jgi:hypothetical protein
LEVFMIVKKVSCIDNGVATNTRDFIFSGYCSA